MLSFVKMLMGILNHKNFHFFFPVQNRIMPSMIEIRNLTKQFGSFIAVNNLNLTIETGEFFGLLGPNGAGKTTTISMISTVLLPTSGEVLIDGVPINRKASNQKRKMSVVTQEYSMRQDMTVEQVMEYQGRLYYMTRREIKQKTEELLEFADLLKFRKRIVRHLSGGMKRKLMICRALMIEPEILLLDEPTAGMDAFSRRQMWNLLRRINERKLTILLTTHYIEEAESLCDRVAMLKKGELDTIASPKQLIIDLGEYAVDEASENGLVSNFFHTREDAIEYLSAHERGTFRLTTLEDVFVERAGANDATSASEKR